MHIYPVILCGGSGTRLWPASRPSRPKQFLPLVGSRSLFQDTVARLQRIRGAEAPIVVAGAGHRAAIVRQLAEMGVEGVLILEPEGRDSAPAIAAAAAWIVARDPHGIAAVVASDHHIPDADAFAASVERAAKAAAAGRIVTFGVKPTVPATAYGYIQPGEPLPGAEAVFAVKRFVEKPDAPTAQAHVQDGYLWNSGNFVFAASTLIEELQRHAPEVAAAASAGLAEAGAAGTAMLGASFRSAPKISIDYAVMERTDRAAVAPVDFAWSDLGAWEAVWAASAKDGDGNAGAAVLIDSRDCLVRSEGPTVVGIGLKRIAVIAEADAVLVCDLASSQGVKAAADRLKAAGSLVVDTPSPAAELPALTEELRRWLFGTALPVWWALGADHDRGGFHEKLDGDSRPVTAPRRARVQARQIYSFATAGDLGWNGPWRSAVEHGLDYFLGRYRRPDGLFRALVGADGAALDDTAMLYDQAFALFAFAASASVLPERAEHLTADARAVVETLRASRSAERGFTEAGGPTPFQANPHMHLLEAALSWEALDPAGPWRGLADEIVELCLSSFIDLESGALREFFDERWSPAPGVDGRIVEPGHQFEWAWLLERWVRLRGEAAAGRAARRLFEVGRRGVDPLRGVAMDALLDDLSVHDASARLWPQTERLKASLILGEDAEAAAAARALKGYLDIPAAGLWRDRLAVDGRFVEEPAPASSLYHIVCAIAEAVRRR